MVLELGCPQKVGELYSIIEEGKEENVYQYNICYLNFPNTRK